VCLLARTWRPAFANVDPIGKVVRRRHTNTRYALRTYWQRLRTVARQFQIIPLHTFEKELHRPRDWVGIRAGG